MDETCTRPLHVDLVQLHEQAEGLDARDVPREHLAELVRHEADLLPLDELALGVGGPALHLREVEAHLGEGGRHLAFGLVSAAVAQGRSERCTTRSG
jgi:hypothetical protein